MAMSAKLKAKAPKENTSNTAPKCQRSKALPNPPAIIKASPAWTASERVVAARNAATQRTTTETASRIWLEIDTEKAPASFSQTKPAGASRIFRSLSAPKTSKAINELSGVALNKRCGRRICPQPTLRDNFAFISNTVYASLDAHYGGINAF